MMSNNSIQYLIVEDEQLSAERLVAMISRLFPDFVHVKTLDSVKSAVRWISQHSAPQLAFFDIQLADGLSFEIFDQVSVPFPVIFTTAYNDYAIRAFKVNSIDYLLKPIDGEELQAAVNKFRAGLSKPAINGHEAIALALSQLTNTYKTRFVVKVGEHLRMIGTADILLFLSAEKSTFLRTIANRDYGIGYTLEQVESMVDLRQFFRINRKYLVHIKSIQDIIVYSNSRLKLKLTLPTDEDLIVSRERVNDFRKWLEGE
ncbi:MAG: response regulator transcription factor [Bacteroidales bacterium]|nr:response regulator transcription factor [Bacteroidales bacterium]